MHCSFTFICCCQYQMMKFLQPNLPQKMSQMSEYAEKDKREPWKGVIQSRAYYKLIIGYRRACYRLRLMYSRELKIETRLRRFHARFDAPYWILSSKLFIVASIWKFNDFSSRPLSICRWVWCQSLNCTSRCHQAISDLHEFLISL